MRVKSIYDDNNWLLQICHQLVEYSQLRSGDRILDIGTGTGQTPGNEDPLSRLSTAQLEWAKTEFEAELAARVTKQGVWDDLTTWYAIDRKPKDIYYYR